MGIYYKGDGQVGYTVRGSLFSGLLGEMPIVMVVYSSKIHTKKIITLHCKIHPKKSAFNYAVCVQTMLCVPLSPTAFDLQEK